MKMQEQFNQEDNNLGMIQQQPKLDNSGEKREQSPKAVEGQNKGGNVFDQIGAKFADAAKKEGDGD